VMGRGIGADSLCFLKGLRDFHRSFAWFFCGEVVVILW